MSRLLQLNQLRLDSQAGLARRVRAMQAQVEPQAFERLALRLRRLTWVLGLAALMVVGLRYGPGLLASVDSPAVRNAWIGGGWAALGTALGVLPLIWARQPGPRLGAFALAFAAGLMAAASLTSLMLPAWADARALGHGSLAATGIVALSVVVGAVVLRVLRHCLPAGGEIHGGHDAGLVPSDAGDVIGLASRRSLSLLVFAIVLHNIPEGWAIGVAGAGAGGPATALTLGIAIQDVPEGLVVALALQAAGVSRLRAALGGIASGLVEPLAAVAGALMVEGGAALLPWALGGAAGAMLLVVAGELMPALRAHRPGRDVLLGALAGLLMMGALDVFVG